MTGRMVLAFILVGLHPAQAQEPLVLRIRPSTPEDVAFAAREAVWERSERRARIAIASVCTGCLLPQSAEPSPPHLLPADTGTP
jgi:hypothetical protein